MPTSYAIDLRWRAVWAFFSCSQVAEAFCLSEQTVRMYVGIFQRTGDVLPKAYVPGPKKLLGTYEQVILLQMVMSRPGIYLHELQLDLEKKFGCLISVPTTRRTLQHIGCTWQSMHHVAIQRSDILRARFMAEISII